MRRENTIAMRLVQGASLLVLASGVASAASAQTQPQAAAPPAPTALAEVVVTAQHVKENVQKTPIAMSVYNSAALKNVGITSINSLSAIAPDLNFSVTEGEPVLTVRGVSSRDVTENGDPAVTVSTDGFYMNRAYSLDAAMYDLERVELLRGPQGTLSGRNSVGGALDIVTAKPTPNFGAYGSVEAGAYNELNVQGMVNLPINDEVQVRASFLSEYHDGYRNNGPEKNADAANNKSGRIEVAFEPTNDFKGLITYQHTSEGGPGDDEENIPFTYANGTLVHSMPAGVNATKFPLYTPESLNLQEDAIRFNFTYDAGGLEYALLGGYDHTQWHHSTDQSNPWSTPSVYGFQQNEYPDTVNAEFRVTSKSNGPFQWQAGLFFFAEDSHLNAEDAAPVAGGSPNDFFGFVYSTQTRSEAGYVQASYQFTDKLKLTGGFRYTNDYKEESGYDGDISAGIKYGGPNTTSESSSQPTYHLALDYDLTKVNMLYAKFDTGYKAGGFNLGIGTYKPENITAYEIGSKNRFLDNSLQVNLALFYNDYTNQQVSSYVALSPTNLSAVTELTENAGASTMYGAEAQITYKMPTIGTLDVSIDYLHARYTNFLSAPDPSNTPPGGTASTTDVQLAGNTPPQSPTWSFSAGLEHSWDVYGGTLTGRIQTKAETSSNFSFYNYADTEQKPYTMSDIFVSYAPAGGHWKVTGFVKNVENSMVFSNAQENLYAYSYTYAFEPPRTFGGRLEYTW